VICLQPLVEGIFLGPHVDLVEDRGRLGLDRINIERQNL